MLKSKNKKSIISNANQKRIQFDKSQNTFEDEEADQKKYLNTSYNRLSFLNIHFRTAGTPMSAIECKDQETQINFKDAACFVRLQEVELQYFELSDGPLLWKLMNPSASSI